jgi:hypothetical protein
VGPEDVSQYCRDVEDHLTRVNGGHLVRIVGAGFELVRRWAEEGVPLSVVCRGIELKADRHRLGRSRHPLRIEFCEADVREVYDGWRRAVGLPRGATQGPDETAPPEETRKRPSLAKHFDRTIDRLSRSAARTDMPPPLVDALSALLEELTRLRESTKGARGAAREDAASALSELDVRMLAAARAATARGTFAELESAAARELGAFRDRLAGDAWRQAVEATTDRLLRDRYGLPTLTL